jgi:hypothetical protein
MMDATYQPTKTNTRHNVLDAVVGMVWGGNIIYGEHDASDALKEKEEQAGTPKGEPPIDLGHLPVEDGIINGL